MADANLKIIAYDSPGGGRTTNEVGTFTVDFNPATFAITNKIEYKKTEAKGQDGGDPQFDKIPPLEFTIDFTIDGTGINPASGNNREYVRNQVKHLRNITGCNINGEIHRPNYLAVLWGTFYIECVLTALNITYNLFDRDGTPIRAKINCGFLERIGAGKGGRKSRLESPDLTRFVTITDGDRLPLLAKGKYGDPAYYVQLAKVNKLKNLRHLATGMQIVLPPMAD